MRKYLPPLILFFLLLIGWQALALGINAAYILPTPIQVIQKLWELREPLFMVHLPATMSVTFIGLGISVVLGLALAIDRFGKDVMMIPVDEDHFNVSVDVRVSRQFLGWVFSLGESVRILGPEAVVDQMKAETQRLIGQYDIK